MTEQELLQDCLRRLNDSFIEYMLVGSMASNYWGIPRSTHDIDFVIQYSDADISQIIQLFDGDFFIQEISVRAALKPPYQFNALDNRSALKVDFFRLAGDAYELERFKRKHTVSILGLPAYLAAPGRYHPAQVALVHNQSIGPSANRLSRNSGCVWRCC